MTRTLRLPLLTGLLLTMTFLGCGYDQAELHVRVLDAVNGNPVARAQVVAGYREAATDRGGAVRLRMRPGFHDVAVSHSAYATLTSTVSLTPTGITIKTVSLQPRPAPTSPKPAKSPGTGDKARSY